MSLTNNWMADDVMIEIVLILEADNSVWAYRASQLSTWSP